MNDFIGRVQKELNKLQKTLQKEGDDLVKKIRTAAKKKNVPTRSDEVAELLETKMRTFEPALEKFYKEVKTNASKYGINLSPIEESLKKTTKKAADKLNIKTKAKKKKTKKAASKAKKAKKTTAKKKKAAATKPKKKTTVKKKTVKKKKKAK